MKVKHGGSEKLQSSKCSNMYLKKMSGGKCRQKIVLHLFDLELLEHIDSPIFEHHFSDLINHKKMGTFEHLEHIDDVTL